MAQDNTPNLNQVPLTIPEGQAVNDDLLNNNLDQSGQNIIQQPLQVAQDQPIDRPNIQPQQDIDDGIRQYTIDEIKPKIDVLLQDPNHDFSTNDSSNNGLLLYLNLNYPKYKEYKQHIDSGRGRNKPTNKAIRALLEGDDSEVDREIEVDRQYAEINKRLANNVFATYNPYKSPTIPERDNIYRSLIYDNVKDIPIIGQAESFARHAILGAVRYGIFGAGNLVVSAIDAGINDKNFLDTLGARGNTIDQGFNNAVGIGSEGNLSFRSEIDRAESNQRLLSYQGRNDDPDGVIIGNTYNYIKRILRSGDLQGNLNTVVGSVGEVVGSFGTITGAVRGASSIGIKIIQNSLAARRARNLTPNIARGGAYNLSTPINSRTLDIVSNAASIATIGSLHAADVVYQYESQTGEKLTSEQRQAIFANTLVKDALEYGSLKLLLSGRLSFTVSNWFRKKAPKRSGIDLLGSVAGLNGFIAGGAIKSLGEIQQERLAGVFDANIDNIIENRNITGDILNDFANTFNTLSNPTEYRDIVSKAGIDLAGAYGFFGAAGVGSAATGISVIKRGKNRFRDSTQPATRKFNDHLNRIIKKVSNPDSNLAQNIVAQQQAQADLETVDALQNIYINLDGTGIYGYGTGVNTLADVDFVNVTEDNTITNLDFESIKNNSESSSLITKISTKLEELKKDSKLFKSLPQIVQDLANGLSSKPINFVHDDISINIENINNVNSLESLSVAFKPRFVNFETINTELKDKTIQKNLHNSIISNLHLRQSNGYTNHQFINTAANTLQQNIGNYLSIAKSIADTDASKARIEKSTINLFKELRNKSLEGNSSIGRINVSVSDIFTKYFNQVDAILKNKDEGLNQLSNTISSNYQDLSNSIFGSQESLADSKYSNRLKRAIASKVENAAKILSERKDVDSDLLKNDIEKIHSTILKPKKNISEELTTEIFKNIGDNDVSLSTLKDDIDNILQKESIGRNSIGEIINTNEQELKEYRNKLYKIHNEIERTVNLRVSDNLSETLLEYYELISNQYLKIQNEEQLYRESAKGDKADQIILQRYLNRLAALKSNINELTKAVESVKTLGENQTLKGLVIPLTSYSRDSSNRNSYIVINTQAHAVFEEILETYNHELHGHINFPEFVNIYPEFFKSIINQVDSVTLSDSDKVFAFIYNLVKNSPIPKLKRINAHVEKYYSKESEAIKGEEVIAKISEEISYKDYDNWRNTINTNKYANKGASEVIGDTLEGTIRSLANNAITTSFKDIKQLVTIAVFSRDEIVINKKSLDGKVINSINKTAEKSESIIRYKQTKNTLDLNVLDQAFRGSDPIQKNIVVYAKKFSDSFSEIGLKNEGKQFTGAVNPFFDEKYGILTSLPNDEIRAEVLEKLGVELFKNSLSYFTKRNFFRREDIQNNTAYALYGQGEYINLSTQEKNTVNKFIGENGLESSLSLGTLAIEQIGEKSLRNLGIGLSNENESSVEFTSAAYALSKLGLNLLVQSVGADPTNIEVKKILNTALNSQESTTIKGISFTPIQYIEHYNNKVFDGIRPAAQRFVYDAIFNEVRANNNDTARASIEENIRNIVSGDPAEFVKYLLEDLHQSAYRIAILNANKSFVSETSHASIKSSYSAAITKSLKNVKTISQITEDSHISNISSTLNLGSTPFVAINTQDNIFLNQLFLDESTLPKIERIFNINRTEAFVTKKPSESIIESDRRVDNSSKPLEYEESAALGILNNTLNYLDSSVALVLEYFNTKPILEFGGISTRDAEILSAKEDKSEEELTLEGQVITLSSYLDNIYEVAQKVDFNPNNGYYNIHNVQSNTGRLQGNGFGAGYDKLYRAFFNHSNEKYVVPRQDQDSASIRSEWQLAILENLDVLKPDFNFDTQSIQEEFNKYYNEFLPEINGLSSIVEKLQVVKNLEQEYNEENEQTALKVLSISNKGRDNLNKGNFDTRKDTILASIRAEYTETLDNLKSKAQSLGIDTSKQLLGSIFKLSDYSEDSFESNLLVELDSKSSGVALTLNYFLFSDPDRYTNDPSFKLLFNSLSSGSFTINDDEKDLILKSPYGAVIRKTFKNYKERRREDKSLKKLDVKDDYFYKGYDTYLLLYQTLLEQSTKTAKGRYGIYTLKDNERKFDVESVLTSLFGSRISGRKDVKNKIIIPQTYHKNFNNFTIARLNNLKGNAISENRRKQNLSPGSNFLRGLQLESVQVSEFSLVSKTNVIRSVNSSIVANQSYPELVERLNLPSTIQNEKDLSNLIRRVSSEFVFNIHNGDPDTLQLNNLFNKLELIISNEARVFAKGGKKGKVVRAITTKDRLQFLSLKQIFQSSGIIYETIQLIQDISTFNLDNVKNDTYKYGSQQYENYLSSISNSLDEVDFDQSLPEKTRLEYLQGIDVLKDLIRNSNNPNNTYTALDIAEFNEFYPNVASIEVDSSKTPTDPGYIKAIVLKDAFLTDSIVNNLSKENIDNPEYHFNGSSSILFDKVKGNANFGKSQIDITSGNNYVKTNNLSIDAEGNSNVSAFANSKSLSGSQSFYTRIRFRLQKQKPVGTLRTDALVQANTIVDLHKKGISVQSIFDALQVLPEHAREVRASYNGNIGKITRNVKRNFFYDQQINPESQPNITINNIQDINVEPDQNQININSLLPDNFSEDLNTSEPILTDESNVVDVASVNFYLGTARDVILNTYRAVLTNPETGDKQFNKDLGAENKSKIKQILDNNKLNILKTLRNDSKIDNDLLGSVGAVLDSQQFRVALLKGSTQQATDLIIGEIDPNFEADVETDIETDTQNNTQQNNNTENTDGQESENAGQAQSSQEQQEIQQTEGQEGGSRQGNGEQNPTEISEQNQVDSPQASGARVLSGRVESLQENEVFVFGSNLGGRHGAGAAKQARDNFGAIYGQGSGLQGRSYAIPTKDESLRPLSLKQIQDNVNTFVAYARANPQSTFLVTAIGTGLSRYSIEQIAPLFQEAKNLSNIVLDSGLYYGSTSIDPNDVQAENSDQSITGFRASIDQKKKAQETIVADLSTTTNVPSNKVLNRTFKLKQANLNDLLKQINTHLNIDSSFDIDAIHQTLGNVNLFALNKLAVEIIDNPSAVEPSSYFDHQNQTIRLELNNVLATKSKDDVNTALLRSLTHSFIYLGLTRNSSTRTSLNEVYDKIYSENKQIEDTTLDHIFSDESISIGANKTIRKGVINLIAEAVIRPDRIPSYKEKVRILKDNVNDPNNLIDKFISKGTKLFRDTLSNVFKNPLSLKTNKRLEAVIDDLVATNVQSIQNSTRDISILPSYKSQSQTAQVIRTIESTVSNLQNKVIKLIKNVDNSSFAQFVSSNSVLGKAAIERVKTLGSAYYFAINPDVSSIGEDTGIYIQYGGHNIHIEAFTNSLRDIIVNAPDLLIPSIIKKPKYAEFNRLAGVQISQLFETVFSSEEVQPLTEQTATLTELISENARSNKASVDYSSSVVNNASQSFSEEFLKDESGRNLLTDTLVLTDTQSLLSKNVYSLTDINNILSDEDRLDKEIANTYNKIPKYILDVGEFESKLNSIIEVALTNKDSNEDNNYRYTNAYSLFPTRNYNQADLANLDAYITLNIIKAQKSKVYSEQFQKILKNEKDGINNLLVEFRKVYLEYVKENFLKQELNLQKGYIPVLLDFNIESYLIPKTTIANKEQVEKEIREFRERNFNITTLEGYFEGRDLLVASTPFSNKVTEGAIPTQGNQVKGQFVQTEDGKIIKRSAYKEIDELSKRLGYSSGLNTDIFDVLNQYSYTASRKNLSEKHTDKVIKYLGKYINTVESDLISTYNIRPRNNDFDINDFTNTPYEALPIDGEIIRPILSNEKVSKFLNKRSFTSTNSESNTKTKYIVLEKRFLNKILGVDEFQASDFINKKLENTEFLTPNTKNIAKKYVKYVDSAWLSLVSVAKDKTVVANPAVVVGNLISNYASLFALLGIPAKFIKQKQAEGFKLFDSYTNESRNFIDLRSRYRVANNDKTLPKKDLDNLKSQLDKSLSKLRDNPFFKFDVNAQTDPIIDVHKNHDVFTGQFKNVLNNLVKNINNKTGGDIENSQLTKLANTLFLRKGTYIYDNFLEITQKSDVISKYIYDQHLQINKSIEPNESFRIASREFVNYTTPIPKSISALDRYGALPFAQYGLKVIRRVLSAYARGGTKFSGLLGLELLTNTNVSSIDDTSLLFSKFGSGNIYDNIGYNLFTLADDLLPDIL